MKQCTKCKAVKAESYFYKRKLMKDGLGSQCKLCMDKARKINLLKNPRIRTDDDRLVDRVQYHLNPERIKRKILKKYGLSVEDYTKLLELQNGVCAVCGTPETKISPTGGTVQSLTVDHDHKTNKVRGLLCSACNLAIGNFKDDPRSMIAAAAYVRRAEPL